MDVSPNAGGTVEVNGAQPDSFPYKITVNMGQNVGLEAFPEDDYQFAYWIEEGELLSDEDLIEVEAFLYPRTFIAYFIAEGGEFLSDDEKVHVIVPEGTIFRDEQGKPLTNLEFSVNDDPPSPPSGSDIIGLSYNLEPAGVTFDQPVTLLLNYDQGEIPAEVTEEDLFLAYYDENNDEWVGLSSVVDPISNIITASIEHLSTFTVIFTTPMAAAIPANFSLSSLEISPAQVNTDKELNISVFVSNTGTVEGSYIVTLKIDGVAEETKNVTLSGGSSETVTFTISKSEAGTYTVDIDGLVASFVVKETKINWFILGPIIVGAAALITFVAVRLKQRDTISDYWKI